MNECKKYVIKKIFEIKKIQVSDKSKFEEILLDSIEFVGLILDIEKNFNFEFKEEELNLDQYVVVGDLIRIINQHL